MARQAVAVVMLGLLACAALASAQDTASVAMAKNRKYGGHEHEKPDKDGYDTEHKEFKPKHYKPEHKDYEPEHKEHEPKHKEPKHYKPEHKEYEPEHKQYEPEHKEHYPKEAKHYKPHSYDHDEEEHYKGDNKKALEASEPIGRTLLGEDDKPESYEPKPKHNKPKHYKPEEHEDEYEPKPYHKAPKHAYKPSHDAPEYPEPEEHHMDLPHKLVKVPHMAKDLEFCADVKNIEGGVQTTDVGGNAWASFKFEMDGQFVGDASVIGVITAFDNDKSIATINARMLAGPKGKFGTGADTLLVATGIIQVQVTGGDRYKLAQPVVMAITGGAGALAGVEGSITFDQEGKATFDITLPKLKPEKTNKLDKDE